MWFLIEIEPDGRIGVDEKTRIICHDVEIKETQTLSLIKANGTRVHPATKGDV